MSWRESVSLWHVSHQVYYEIRQDPSDPSKYQFRIHTVRTRMCTGVEEGTADEWVGACPGPTATKTTRRSRQKNPAGGWDVVQEEDSWGSAWSSGGEGGGG